MEINKSLEKGSENFSGRDFANKNYVIPVEMEGPYSYEMESWESCSLRGIETHFRITPVPFKLEDVCGVFYD